MNKAIAFILGLILGGVFLLGAIGMATYAGLVMVHPADVVPSSKDYVGDLADMSIYDIWKTLYALYNEKVGEAGADGKYYTIGEFCKTYNIDTEKAFGVKLEGDVADIPMLEFLSTEANADGENGFQRTLKQIKLSAVPAVINMFGGTDEDGNPKEIVASSAIEKLAEHSLYDLIANEEVGLAGCFAEVEFAEVMPSAFPTDENTDNKLMYALGKTKIGKMLNALSDDSNLFAQMKEGGAMEQLGSLTFTDILGSESELITSFLGGKSISSLISDEGNLVPDGLLDEIKLGTVLSLKYDEEEGVWKDADGKAAEGFFASIADLSVNDVRDTRTLSAIDLGGLFGFVKNPANADNWDVEAVKLFAENDAENAVAYYKQVGDQYALCAALDYNEETGAGKWYEAEVKCDGSDNGNHTATCIDYVWYGAACEQDHDHTSAGEKLIGETYHGKPSGIFAALVGIKVGDLTSGNSDKIMDSVKNIKIADILGETEGLNDIVAAIADLTVNDLMTDGINTVRFGTIFALKRLEWTGEVGTLEELYENGTAAEGEKPLYKATVRDGDGNEIIVLSDDGKTYYYGKLTCADEACAHLKKSCYDYAWYVKCSETDHTACENEVEIDGEKYVPATGALAKLADLTIDSLSDLNSVISDLTLADVLGDNIPDMFDSIKDVTIGNIGTEIDKLYVGDLLGYERAKFVGENLNAIEDGLLYSATTIDGETIYVKADGENKYVAELTCTDETEGHHHTAACYDYVWYKSCADNCAETHTHYASNANISFKTENTYSKTDGVESVLAGKTISDLSNVNDILQNEITLGSVLGDNIPAMLAPLADVTVANLSTAIDGLHLGGVLGYVRQDVQKTADNTTEIDGGKVLQTANGFAKKDGKKYYEAELTCAESHDHTADCYEFVWYAECDKGDHTGSATHTVNGYECQERTIDGKTGYFVRAGGIVGKLAAKTVGGLSDVNDIITSSTLYDVLGDDVPSMLDSIKYEPIGSLQNALDKLYLGDALGYVKAKVDENDYPATKFENVKTNGNDVAIKSGDNWFEGKLDCDESHEHTSDCYGYVWYVKCGETDHTNCENEVEIVLASGETARATVATGVTGKLAGEKISELGTSLNDKITSFTLTDVLGENVPDMLKSIADTKIGDLDGAIKTLTVGNLLGGERNELTETTDIGDIYVRGATITYADGTTADVLAKLDGETYYEAKLTCADKTEGHDHTSACYDYVWYEKCQETDHTACGKEIEIGGERYKVISGVLSHLVGITVSDLNGDTVQGIIGDITLGEVITIDENSPKILEKFKDTKIDDLSTSFADLTLGDVIDTSAEGTNGLIKELAGCKVDEIGTAINDVKLGAAWNYSKTEAAAGATMTAISGTTTVFTSGGKTYVKDGEKYYEAELTCKNEDTTHTHDDSCYEIVWKDGSGNNAQGITKAIANLTIADMSDNTKLKEQINKLTLGDVMDNTRDNTILKAIADKPINELASSLNEMEMGTIFGYTKGDDGWYTNENELVKGINAQLADKTLSDISSGDGINSIILGMTMGDLVDSGVVTVEDDNAYKMAIFANEWTADYLIKKTAAQQVGATLTAEQYCTNKGATETQLNSWKKMQVQQLFDAILGALD